MADYFKQKDEFCKPYNRVYGRKHIIVCGNITYESCTSFLKNFLHEDAPVHKATDIVFIGT